MVDVVVCDQDGQRPAADLRADWLAAVRPTAQVHTVADLCGWHAPHRCPVACSGSWAAHLRTTGLGPWDLVVTSEDYGAPFAAELGAEHVAFDPARTVAPCSGTLIRGDLAGGWPCLHPVVRRGLTRKLVVVGAESTGTTTLADDLAAALVTTPVAEYGRAYSAAKARSAGSLWDVEWTSDDFERIATGQAANERCRLEASVDDPTPPPGPLGPWLVCDTDLLATAVWHERYLRREAPGLVERALSGSCSPTLYVLTPPTGVAFHQDGLRDGEHLREAMTSRFRAVLGSTAVPWMEVAGDRPERTRAVLDRLRALPPLLHQPIAGDRHRPTPGGPERAPARE